MKIILFFILFLLIGLALYQFFRIREYKVIGDNLVKDTRAYSAHPPNATKRILIAGDSLAVGVGSSEPTYSIAGRIGEDYPNADITNVAVSGARIKDVIHQLSSFQKNQFDLVLIQIGGNNVTHFTPLGKIRTDAHTMMQQAKNLSSNVVVWSYGSAGFAAIFNNHAFRVRLGGAF
jgi:lysophospholipase L1-like esterase